MKTPNLEKRSALSQQFFEEQTSEPSRHPPMRGAPTRAKTSTRFNQGATRRLERPSDAAAQKLSRPEDSGREMEWWSLERRIRELFCYCPTSMRCSAFTSKRLSMVGANCLMSSHLRL